MHHPTEFGWCFGLRQGLAGLIEKSSRDGADADLVPTIVRRVTVQPRRQKRAQFYPAPWREVAEPLGHDSTCLPPLISR